MKLGILCTMINGFGKKGFYNTQEIGLGRALARKGHTVTIYKCQKKTGDSEEETIELEPGLTLLYLPIGGGVGAHGYLKASVLDRDMDGLLCFADTQVFLPHIYRFCKKNGIRFVPYVGSTYSVHDGLHGKVMDTWFAMSTLKIYRKNRLIAKTEGARQELLALGVDDRNIVIAPVGLDTAVLKHDYRDYDRNELRAKFGFAADDVLICSVLRLEPDKCPLELIDIFEHIKNEKKFKMLLVGDGYLRPEVDKKIAEYQLEDKVKIINRIPNSEIWEIYTMSDYFANLNRDEIFGMAVMEAVYYGTSVAAHNAPGPAFILYGLDGHCLCENDRAIEKWLVGEYPSREALAESSEKLAKNMSWDRCADTFAAIVGER